MYVRVFARNSGVYRVRLWSERVHILRIRTQGGATGARGLHCLYIGVNTPTEQFMAAPHLRQQLRRRSGPCNHIRTAVMAHTQATGHLQGGGRGLQESAWVACSLVLVSRRHLEHVRGRVIHVLLERAACGRFHHLHVRRGGSAVVSDERGVASRNGRPAQMRESTVTRCSLSAAGSQQLI